MENPFGSANMAAGYATARPPVHPRVMERVCRRLGRIGPFPFALDIGCGAGISTKALDGIAERCTGLEPAESMLKFAPKIAPFARFLAGRAEAIPLRDRSVDLMTAAGSLNYADPDLFFPEAARVLKTDGVLVVYDFSPGRTFRDSTALDEWFAEFHRRYPPPANEARDLNPAILGEAATGFRVFEHEDFEIELAMARGAYVDYVMTETNVAAAVRGGASLAQIKSWCTETVQSVWNGGEREVLFRGYFACLRPA